MDPSKSRPTHPGTIRGPTNQPSPGIPGHLRHRGQQHHVPGRMRHRVLKQERSVGRESDDGPSSLFD